MTATRTIQVTYHGHVQGVGFRATTADIARRFSVTGSVRNQRDGTVELVAQGEPEAVQNFLEAIARRFATRIIQAVTSSVSGPEVFTEFQIRH